MKKMVIVTLMFLLSIGLVSAESYLLKGDYVPTGEVFLLFDGEEVAEFEGIFLSCDNATDFLGEHPRFKINLFDEERGCFFRPLPYADEITCIKGICQAYDIPLNNPKIAIRYNFRMYITNEVDVFFGISDSLNSYVVELYSNGSAFAKYLREPETSDVPIGPDFPGGGEDFPGEDDNQPEKDYSLLYLLSGLLIIGGIVYGVMKKNPKKKLRR